jgi:hypothetical protein
MKKQIKNCLISLCTAILVIVGFDYAYAELHNGIPKSIICPRCTKETTTVTICCIHCGYRIPWKEDAFMFRKYKVVDTQQLVEDEMHFKSNPQKEENYD